METGSISQEKIIVQIKKHMKYENSRHTSMAQDQLDKYVSKKTNMYY
jgi:hypothetical protein